MSKYGHKTALSAFYPVVAQRTILRVRSNLDKCIRVQYNHAICVGTKSVGEKRRIQHKSTR